MFYVAEMAHDSSVLLCLSSFWKLKNLPLPIES